MTSPENEQCLHVACDAVAAHTADEGSLRVRAAPPAAGGGDAGRPRDGCAAASGGSCGTGEAAYANSRGDELRTAQPRCLVSASASELCQPLEIRIRRLEVSPVTPGARRNQDVRRRHGDSGASRPACELVRTRPDVVVDREFQQHFLEVAQALAVAITRCTVPQFEPHQRTPARFPRGECCFDSRSHHGITVRTQEMNPRRTIDQDHCSTLSTLRLQLFRRDQRLCLPRVLEQCRHPPPPVVVGDGSDNCLALCSCPREPHDRLEFVVWNINGCLHDSNHSKFGFPE